jgi:tight adherence protein B
MSTGMLIFIGLIFVAVFLLAQGLIVPVFGESARTRRLLQQRLKQIELDQDAGPASLVREKYLKQLSPFERWVESLPIMQRLAGLIEQAGHTTAAHRLVVTAIVLCVVAGSVGWSFSHLLPVAIAAAVAGFALPFIKMMHDRKQRFEKLDEQLPDAVDVMKRAMRAGHPFNSALRLVAEDMGNPIAQEFQTTFADINYGNDVRRALLGLLVRVPSVSMMAVVTSVLVQRETGRDLRPDLQGHPVAIPVRAQGAHAVGGRAAVRVDPHAHAHRALRGDLGDDADLPACAARQTGRPEAADVRRRHGDSRNRVDAQDHPHRGVTT